MAALSLSSSPLRNLWEVSRAYLRRPLISYFANPSNRALIHHRLGVFLLVAVTFGKVLMPQRDILETHPGFYFTHALHMSLAYIIGVLLAELAARRLFPAWSAYQRRTVARQWLIWGLGFGLGLVLYRVSASLLLPLYAPRLMALVKQAPGIKPSEWEILLFCGTVWAVATFAVIQSALCWQRQRRGEEKPSSQPLAAEGPAPQAEAQAPPPAPTALRISHDGRQTRIPLERITHVTVEDHYCRIHYLGASGPKNLFACMTLKSLAEQLPDHDFAQIHRSHLVNLRHVSGLERDGDQYLAHLAVAQAALPVSRRRRAGLRERLNRDNPAN